MQIIRKDAKRESDTSSKLEFKLKGESRQKQDKYFISVSNIPNSNLNEQIWKRVNKHKVIIGQESKPKMLDKEPANKDNPIRLNLIKKESMIGKELSPSVNKDLAIK